MPTNKLTFVHLSDIHFVRGYSEESPFDLDRVLREAILADATMLEATVTPICGILITGDVAFAGKASEYAVAVGWLAALADRLNCGPEFVWCVPGNHDIDRSVLKQVSAIPALHEQLRRSRRLDEHLREHLENDVAGPMLFAPLKTYNEEFAAKFNCVTSPRHPWWEQDFELNDSSTLRIRGLNSAIVSDSEDNDRDHKLLLGTAQTQLGRHPGVEYMTLCHHPIDWLSDGGNVDEALLAYARVQLFGHKHKQRVLQINNSVRISAGAVHPAREEQEWTPQYNYISLEVQGTGADRFLAVDVYTRVWNQSERLFVRQPNSDNADRRTCRLKLAEWTPPMRPPVGATSTRHDFTEQHMSPQENLSGRKMLYRFIGLPHHTRMTIMEQFGLLEKGDEIRPDAEMFAACFERARKKGILVS